MKDHSYNIIIRRSLLALGLAVVGSAAWAVDVTTAEELKEALAGTETTITLKSSITLSETMTISRGLTLDLNGHSVAAMGFRAFHVTDGIVAITSTTPASISVGGSIDDNKSVIRLGDNSGAARTIQLTIDENVSVNTDRCYGITVFGSATTETLIVRGTVNTTGVPAISGNGNPGLGNTTITIDEKAVITTEDEVAIYHPQSGTLTVNGTVTGAGGIEMKGGQLIVGPTAKITATASPSHTANNDGCSTQGYAIAIVENGEYAGVSTVNVSKDATIEGPVAVVKDSDKKAGAPETIFDPAGLQMNVKVKDGSTSKILGQFLTLEDAMREVPASGSTIQLYANQTLTNTLKTDKSYTLDLNGHSLTCDGNRALHIMGGDVSITNTSIPTTESIISSVGGVASSSSVIRLGDNTGEARTASLTIGKDVTISAETCYGITVFGSKTTETLTVNGNVKTINYPAIGGNGSAGYGNTTITIAEGAEVTSEKELAIYHPQAGTLTVNGNVTGAGGIEMKGGSLTVGPTAKIKATAEPTHNPESSGSSTLGYAIAIVENGGGYAGVEAVSIDNDAKIDGIVAQLQDSPKDGFAPSYTGTAVTKKVAAIDENKYFNLDDAISIVPAAGKVRLLDDLILSAPLSMDKEKTYTLDLAGYNLTGSNGAVLHIKSGHVTLDNSGAGEHTISATGGTPRAAIILGDGTGTNRNISLTIKDKVTVHGGSLSPAILVEGTQTRESLYVSGKVAATGHSAIVGADITNLIQVETAGTVTASDAVVIYHPQSGNLVVKGTVVGTGTTAGAIEMKGGNLTVATGATVTATGTPSHTAKNTAPSTNGYAIALVERDGFPGVGKVNVSNAASITGVIACLVDSRNTSVAEPRFTGDVQMVAETRITDGHGDKYAKLAEAITATAASDEVRLLDDLTVTGPLAIDKVLTLNLDDYTLTGSQTEGSTIAISGNATVTNGSIVAEQGGISVTGGTVQLQQLTLTTGGESLTIAGGDVTADATTSLTSTAHHTIALSAGSLTLQGKVYNTSTSSSNHAVAASGAANLTMASTSTVSAAHGNGINWASTGALTIDGGKVAGAEAIDATAGTITIEGGTFTGTGHAVSLADCTPTVNGGTFICGGGADYQPITVTHGSMANFVKGDYFSKAIDQTLCASGYMVAANPRSNGMYYLVNELVINDGTNWTPTTSFTIGTARYVRNSGMGAGGTQFGTLCLPFSFSATQPGMKFYTVNRIADNTLYLDAVTSDNIEAGTPVVFQFTEATTNFTIESTNALISSSDATAAGNLVGTFAKKELTTSTSPTASSVYFLNGDAFHQAHETLTVPAFRAYIQFSSPSNQRALYIHTDDAVITGIDDALRYDDDALRYDDAVVYDLEGHRHDTLQPGVNVVRTSDGRTIKVVVR